MRPHHLAASSVVALAGAVTSSLLGFALVAVVGRGLGVADTGIFFQVVGWFMVTVALLRCGADTGLLRTLAQQRVDNRVADIRQTLLVALVPLGAVLLGAAVTVHLAAPGLAAWAGGSGATQEANLVAALGWCVPPAVVLLVLMGALRGLGSIIGFTLVQNVALPGLRLALVSAVLVLGVGGLPAVLTAWVTPLPILAVVAAVAVARGVRRLAVAGLRDASRSPSHRTAARGFWGFSAARGVAAFLETLLEWSDVLIVAALLSPAEAGIYAVVTRVVRAGLVVETATRVAVAPRIAALLGHDDRVAASVIFTGVTRGVVLVAWPFFFLLIVFAPAVLGLFGEGFTAGAVVMSVLAGAMMVTIAAGMVQSLLLMGGRSHYQMANKFAALVTSVAINLSLVPVVGLAGAALAAVAALAVDTGLAAHQVRRRMGIVLELRALALPVLLTGAFAAGCVLVRVTVGGGLDALAAAVLIVGPAYLGLVATLQRRLRLGELVRL
jgi:O-antigen/teichoic acid export membrane protein